MLAPPLPAFTSIMPAAFRLCSALRMTTGLTLTLAAINSDVTFCVPAYSWMTSSVCTATVNLEVIFMAAVPLYSAYCLYYTTFLL